MTAAAIAARAEGVMLNKGPHLGESIDVLAALPRLRALRAWDRSG